MPKYELMYIIGAHLSDDQIPASVAEIKKVVEGGGGTIEKHEELGKKKLAYPIKNQRAGYYVLVNFEAAADKVNEIEHKVRTSGAVVRHIIINMDEALIQMEKDRIVQAKLKLRPKVEKEPEIVKAKPVREGKKIQIDLDAEIEKALESEDLK